MEEGHIGDSGMAEVRKDATPPVNKKDSSSCQFHTLDQHLPHTRAVATRGTSSFASQDFQLSGIGAAAEAIGFNKDRESIRF